MALTVNGRPVPNERSNWRDQSISNRHNTWGRWATAIDIDFILIESTIDAVPKALIEYKHYKWQYRHGFQLRLFSTLANMAGVPAFLAKYWPDIWAFRVSPQNDHAREWLKSERTLTEREYVDLLRRLRGVDEVLPEHLMDNLPPIEQAA